MPSSGATLHEALDKRIRIVESLSGSGMIVSILVLDYARRRSDPLQSALMPTDPRDKPPQSSIVARAIDASTFTEMQAFVADLEGRPVERLLRDVAGLVKPSDSKAQIVGYVIATKHRYGTAEERTTILDSLQKTIEELPAGDTRERVEAIVERIRVQDR